MGIRPSGGSHQDNLSMPGQRASAVPRSEWERTAVAFDCILNYSVLRNTQKVKNSKEKIVANGGDSGNKADLA